MRAWKWLKGGVEKFAMTAHDLSPASNSVMNTEVRLRRSALLPAYY